jgi:hypothetical protein
MADEIPNACRERQITFLRGRYERHLARLHENRGGPFEIRVQEAELPIHYPRASGLAFGRGRLECQSRHDAGCWRDQPVAGRAGVLLGNNGDCRVYAARPNACRKLRVTSDPQHFDIPRGEQDRIEPSAGVQSGSRDDRNRGTGDLRQALMPLAEQNALRDAGAAGGGG